MKSKKPSLKNKSKKYYNQNLSSPYKEVGLSSSRAVGLTESGEKRNTTKPIRIQRTGKRVLSKFSNRNGL